jgi:mono/diheme cytochrome c family protein
MKRALPARVLFSVISVCAVVVLAVVVSACAPNAESVLISPDMAPQLAAQAAGEVVAAVPTEPPPTLGELTPEEIYAGLPDDVASAVSNGNIANAPVIATARGCIGCHSLDPNQKMTGPTWYNIGNTAITRVEGEGPALYLYHSIMTPNAFVVPDYPSGVMPQTYGEQLSTQDLGDLIAYLLSQTQGE